MRHTVVRKQPNSKMCLVCGLQNPHGLHAAFFELSGGLVHGMFDPRDELQGYPGRLHGGIATALLDETLGRTIMVHQPDEFWGVTIDLNFRFRQPIPLDRPVRAVAQLVEDGKRFFTAHGRVVVGDGVTAVEAHGRFMKLKLERIAEFDPHEQMWQVCPLPTDPAEVDI